jgi:hypothetical protein
MQSLLAYANGSISGIYGCIGYTLQEMIKQEFAKDFFKYTSMASELATRNVRRVLGANSGKEIAKRIKPELIIQPTFATMDEGGPMQGIPLTTNFHNLQYRTDKNYLLEAIRDKKNGYALKFRMNRDKIDYDVTINLDTLDQQINVYKMMQNKFVWGITQAKQVALESVIPKRLIGTISKLCGMDLDESLDYIPMLIRRLNSCSGYPITYKVRNASATDEWFLYYTHRVCFTFQDLTHESGMKKNMSEDRYPITFRVSAEFNLPGCYFLEALRNMDLTVSADLVSKTDYGSDYDTMFPLFTIPNILNRFPAEKNGMQLYGTSIFKTDPPKDPKNPPMEDRISLQGLLDNDHIRVIRTHISWKMNPASLLAVEVLKNNEDLVYGRDFEIDWNSLDLVVRYPDQNSTYRIAMYFNYTTVNEILNNDTYANAYDVSQLKVNEMPEQTKDGVYIPIQGTPIAGRADELVDENDPRSGQPNIDTLHPLEEEPSPADIHNLGVLDPLIRETIERKLKTPPKSDKDSCPPPPETRKKFHSEAN